MRKPSLFALYLVVLAIAIRVTPVMAQSNAQWSPWHTVQCAKLGCSLSVSFSKVSDKMYSWKFRNDGSQAISTMEFKYTFIDAESGQATTQPDMIPSVLAPGKVWGGWATYSAHTKGTNPYSGGDPVSFRITSVTLGK